MKCNTNFETLTFDELDKELDLSYKAYKSLKKDAAAIRISFLESLAEAHEKAGNGKKSKIIERMIKLEEQRKLYRKLRPLSKKFSKNLSTTSVIQTRHGRTIEINDKTGMENAIIEANTKKYHQTETSCPFLMEPVKSQVGDYGETKQIEEVLSGNYNAIKDVDASTKLFLRICKSTNTFTDMPRTPEQFK